MPHPLWHVGQGVRVKSVGVAVGQQVPAHPSVMVDSKKQSGVGPHLSFGQLTEPVNCVTVGQAGLVMVLTGHVASAPGMRLGGFC